MNEPRAYVDHDVCMGVAMCRSIAPAAFRLDTNGKSVFVADSGAAEDDLVEAIENCPVEAIRMLTGHDQ